MAEKRLPEGEELPLDQPYLQQLIKSALLAACRNLIGTAVRQRPSLVYLPTGKEGPKYMGAPDYRSGEVWDKVAEVWKSEESEKLTDYLWLKGAEKRTLWSDNDAEPIKDSWARFVWGEWIHGSLLHLLWLATTRDLSKEGKYRLWHVDDDAIDEAAADIAGRICNKGYALVAICPVMGLKLINYDQYTLMPELVLRKCTPEEGALFATRYHYHYAGDSLYSFSDTVIKLCLRIQNFSESAALDLIARTLDQLKWATMIAADTDSVFEESTIVITTPTDKMVRQSFRRGEVFFIKRGFKITGIEETTAHEITNLLQRLRSLAKKFPELDSALWYFGRACVAQLAQDALLDAVVGLEMILVPDSGESTYKFKLHGTVLLFPFMDQSVGTLETNLKMIYDLRSKAAHGSAKDLAKFEEFAPKARLLLAKAILAIIELTEKGDLDLKATNGDIGKAVVQLVRNRATGTNLSKEQGLW